MSRWHLVWLLAISATPLLPKNSAPAQDTFPEPLRPLPRWAEPRQRPAPVAAESPRQIPRDAEEARKWDERERHWSGQLKQRDEQIQKLSAAVNEKWQRWQTEGGRRAYRQWREANNDLVNAQRDRDAAYRKWRRWNRDETARPGGPAPYRSAQTAGPMAPVAPVPAPPAPVPPLPVPDSEPLAPVPQGTPSPVPGPVEF